LKPLFEKSKQEFDLVKDLIPGGVNSGFRYRDPFPLYFSRAEGSRLWDIDGNEYLDFLVANGACILGHKDPLVTKAVEEQLQTGLTSSLESELSIDVAKLLHEMIPSAESVKFSNTGTEAVMHAFQIARGYTGKNGIIKTEGSYHGWQDEAHLSVHPTLRDNKSPGEVSTRAIPEVEGYARSSAENILVVPFNNVEAAKKCIRENRDRVAALILEPIVFNSGCILPQAGYLKELREITARYDVLLVFDEVITGFRTAPGGAQEFYNVIPDLSIFGKAIANGFPLSAVVGKEEVMKVTAPKTGRVAFSGTYNGAQPSLAASKACLTQLKDGTVQNKLHSDSKTLINRFEEAARESRMQARLQSISGQFQVYFTDEPVTDYSSAARADRTKYAFLCDRLLDSGMLFHQSYLFHHGVSNAHNAADLEKLCESFAKILGQLRNSNSP
jgi:glutamate-1-semialdehyde 2,1-aminomutase